MVGPKECIWFNTTPIPLQFRRMRALEGMAEGAEVTKHVSAPLTCDVEVPRICLTPSRRLLKP
jgi:hypothetical protein